MNKEYHARISSGIAFILCMILSSVLASDKDNKTLDNRVLIRSLVIKPGVQQCLESATNALLITTYGPISFSHESSTISADGTRVWLNGDAKLEETGWTILQADANRIILPISDADYVIQKAGPVKTIILDPGHGGDDPGATGTSGVKEKILTLDIAKRVRKHLCTAGYLVKLTRGADASVAHDKRTDLAKDWNADLFVSIHLNWAQNPLASGLETFVLPAPGLTSTLNGNGDKKECDGNKHDSESIAIASQIHSDILAATKSPDRGIKHARFNVLCTAPCPAILLECGFLSNLKEERKLLDDEYLEKIAIGISNGIKNCNAKK